MSGAISVSPSSRADFRVAPVRGSPDLDAQLATCRSQLEDWVTCPSAKTPEGKAKIEHITVKFDAIKARIKQSADQSASAVPAAASTARGSEAVRSEAAEAAAATYARPMSNGRASLPPGTASLSAPGTRVDVFV